MRQWLRTNGAAAEHGWSARLAMHWMLRIVDVRAALETRGYPPGLSASLELEVTDDLLPSNEGRVTLEVDEGTANVHAGGAGRIAIDIRGLASLYSAHQSGWDLVTSGLMRATPTDAARASAVFAGPPPWMADMF